MITLQLLGDPLLRGPEGPITGRASYRRRLALLAILAAARGRPVGRERLVGLLWGELPGDAARRTLSESLYVLRKDLGEETFVVVGDEVGLSPARARSDLDDFETALEEGRAEDAMRAYTGPFLDGFYVSDAPEFERWAEGERARLASAHARAAESLAEAGEAAGDPLRAAEWWRRLAVSDPFSSRVALRLARALRQAGEHAAALRHAETHAALLHQELGVGPDPELAVFVEQLRAEAVPLPPRPVPTPLPVPAPDPEPLLRAAPEPPAVEVSPAAPPPPPEAPLPAAASTAPPLPRRRWLVAAGAAGALALAALLGLGGTVPRAGSAPVEPGRDPRRIAVLYFDDHSPGGRLGYLAGGLTEMLIHEMSQVEALDVVSRGGVKPYRAGTVPLDSVAARLGVGSLVEGSVQASGDSVRVTVQLIDANTLSHLESRVVTRPMGDVLALESALAEEVGGFLRRRLGRAVRLREAGAETRSADARTLVLRAGQAMEDAVAMAESADSLDAASALRLLGEADSLLARAEREDPAWARPAVLRGRVALLAANRWRTPRRGAFLVAAERHAARALARDPRSAEALQVRGTARWWSASAGEGPGDPARLEAAERDLRAAVSLDPAFAPAWGALARLLLVRGSLAEAELAARRALAADAYLEDADVLLLRLFFAALGQGDHRAAREACGRGARLFPGHWRFVECRLTLLREDPSLPPDPALAWRLVAELERLDPPARARAGGRAYAPLYRHMVAASVSARGGDADSARAVVARARMEAAADPSLGSALAYDEAHVLLLLGERGAARARLDEYAAARPELRAFLARDPLFRELYAAPPPATVAAAPRP